jgi:hypothetical protein
MAGTFKASPQIVGDYLRLFVNRRAYTMQSMRPHPESGRYYYFRPGNKQNGTPPALTKETIRRHLEGEITIGLYAISPYTQRCKWVAIDADYKNALEDLLKLQYHLSLDKVEAALEMSKREGHLWIFLATPLLAKECRIYIHDLAARLGLPVKGWGLADGIEVFPRHNAIGDGRFGNAIRGPLGIHRAADRRFWFYGADHTLQAQMAYLNGLRKLTEDELQGFIAGKEVLQDEPRRQSDLQVRTGRRVLRSEFHILEHVGKVRKVGRNYVGRCPSCAESGHDRAADNLAILIEDSRFYRCWAGCTKQMIRVAVGQPIRLPQRTRAKSGVLKRNRFRDATGLRLPRPSLRVLRERGIVAPSPVSLQYQHQASRYVVRGTDSGGAAGDIGRYVSFAQEEGQAIECLQPVEAIGVNGLHAVVVAVVLVRVELLRKGRAYTLLITRHAAAKSGIWPGKTRRKRVLGCRSSAHYPARSLRCRNT